MRFAGFAVDLVECGAEKLVNKDQMMEYGMDIFEEYSLGLEEVIWPR